MCSYLYVKDTCARQHLNNVIFNWLLIFVLFVLIWVYLVAYIRDLLLYLIKLVTLSQVLHFNDGAAVWVCLCSNRLNSGRGRFGKKKPKTLTLLLNELKKSFVEFQIGPRLPAPAVCFRIFSSSVMMLWNLAKSFVVSWKPRGNTRREVKSDFISRSRLYMRRIRTSYFKSIDEREEGGKKPSEEQRSSRVRQPIKGLYAV